MPAPSYNPFYPTGYAQQLQIARSQALADALTKEGEGPIQYDPRGAISPFQGLNKMAQALTGTLESNRAIDQAQQYGQGQSQAMAQMFGQPAPQALAGGLTGSSQGAAPGNDGAQGGVAPQGGGLPGPTNDPRTNMLAYMLSPEAYAKGMIDKNMPTSEMKNAAAGGALGFKTTYVPPVDLREGGTALDPRTQQPVFVAPKDGIQTQYGPNGPVSAPVPGFAEADADKSGQVQRAKEQNTIKNISATIDGKPTADIPAYGAQNIITPGQNAGGPFGASGGSTSAPPVPSNQSYNSPPPVGGPPAPGPASLPEGPTNLGTSVNSPPTSVPPVITPGISLSAKAGAETGAQDTAKNVAEAQKTFAAANAGLPQVLQRLQDMHAVAKDASYGAGINEEGEGLKVTGHNMLNDTTSQANSIMRQKPAQNIIAELGPQLAQGGMRGNKFLETLSSKASGINLDDSPSGKAAAINGLQQTYIGNLKAEAATIRAQGGNAPSDADIDAQVAKISGGLHQEGQTATNPQTNQKLVYHYGQWTPQ